MDSPTTPTRRGPGAPKGTRPPNAGKGRAKGSKNKINRDVGEAVLRALDKAGGDEYLLQLAKNEPRTFGALLGKLMPTQLTGAGGGPIKTEALGAGNALILETIRELSDRVRSIGVPPGPAPESEAPPAQVAH
jgi:hypothetical protein